MKDQVIERYIEQNARRLDEVEAQLTQLLAELTRLREIIEGALQMLVVVHEGDETQ